MRDKKKKRESKVEVKVREFREFLDRKAAFISRFNTCQNAELRGADPTQCSNRSPQDRSDIISVKANVKPHPNYVYTQYITRTGLKKNERI